MENQAFSFDDASCLYLGTAGFTGEDGFLDSSLQSPSTSSPNVSMWDAPVQRFLQDPQRTAFFNIKVALDPNRSLLARPALGPVSPDSNVSNRFASPMSLSDHRSSASASDDAFLPGTPPDTALLSPFPRPMQYDYGSPSPTTHALQFMGPTSPANAYVHLTDVNPLQQQQQQQQQQHLDWYDPDALCSFTLAHQPYTHNDYTPATGPSDFEQAPAVRQSLGESGDDNDADILQPVEKEDTRGLTAGFDDDHEEKGCDVDDRDGEHRAGRKQKTHCPPKKRAKMGSSQQEAAYPACGQCCAAPFKNAIELERHVKKQHTRPYYCVFHFAGCGDKFASKNEWKRHTNSQHLLPDYWLCTEGDCALVVNSGVGTAGSGTSAWTSKGKKEMKPRKRSRDEHDETVFGSLSLPNGKIFNRKDLYTQHLRRLHRPADVKTVKPARKTTGSKNGHSEEAPSAASVDWDQRERMLQACAKTKRCALPDHMECPAAACGVVFDGPDAWDQRMEHVAQHLEDNEAVAFGGPTDTWLTAWASAPGVAIIRETKEGRWVLNDPLKRGMGDGMEALGVGVLGLSEN